MANYYEAARSNYFQVKDLEAFKNEVSTWDGEVEVVANAITSNVTKVAMLFDSESGLPWSITDEETGEEVEIDYADFFKRHLVDDHVAIIMGTGAEKLRYINGYAIAFNNKGETVEVTLDSIYKLAKPLGKVITHASY